MFAESNDPERRLEEAESKGQVSYEAMSWHMYIAQGRIGRYYVGISTNPELRLVRHNMKDGADFAVRQGPLKIVYVSPPLPGKSEARKREMQVKRWTRVKKEKLIRGEWI